VVWPKLRAFAARTLRASHRHVFRPLRLNLGRKGAGGGAKAPTLRITGLVVVALDSEFIAFSAAVSRNVLGDKISTMLCAGHALAATG